MLEYEQHIGLENSEIRDFLSQSLLKIYNESNKASTILSDEKKKIFTSGDKTPLAYAERALSLSQKDLDYAIELNRLAKMRLGVLTIMNERNWKEHDMGEYLQSVTYPYLNFIGTDEEAQIIRDLIIR